MVVKENLGQVSGKLTNVLALEPGKFETNWRGSGTFLGHEIKDCGKVSAETLENGSMKITGFTNITTDGGSATLKGFAIAKKEGLAFPAGNFAGCGEFLKATGVLKSLADKVFLAYFDVDADENYHYKVMEWAHD